MDEEKVIKLIWAVRLLLKHERDPHQSIAKHDWSVDDVEAVLRDLDHDLPGAREFWKRLDDLKARAANE
jgi:hypothetical protein